jgi:predicted nuclease with TOPRIM domain
MRIVTWIVLLSLTLFLSGCATMGPVARGRSLETEVKELKSENEVLMSERDAYKSEAERLSNETGKAKAQLASLQDSLSQERQKVLDLQSKIEALSDELQSLKEIAVYEAPELAPSDFTKKVQLALYAAGFDPGKIDGKMGTQTIQAVKDFQEANGLKVDGIVGKETWDRLQEYLEMK